MSTWKGAVVSTPFALLAASGCAVERATPYDVDTPGVPEVPEENWCEDRATAVGLDDQVPPGFSTRELLVTAADFVATARWPQGPESELTFRTSAGASGTFHDLIPHGSWPEAACRDWLGASVRLTVSTEVEPGGDGVEVDVMAELGAVSLDLVGVSAEVPSEQVFLSDETLGWTEDEIEYIRFDILNQWYEGKPYGHLQVYIDPADPWDDRNGGTIFSWTH